MERDELKKILGQVKAGKLDIDKAIHALRSATVADLGFATVDLQRALRRGFPEVIFGAGKTPEQIVEIARSLDRSNQTILVTRVAPEVATQVREQLPRGAYNETARTIVVHRGTARRRREGILVVTGGTTDLPVAEEAVVTAEVMGNRVERSYDVGVAGLHRLLAQREKLLAARVIVAVAGMEGALPSVIAGLTDCPVIGVPTSSGYGWGGQGRAALLAMLNSCASGLTVVNVDNGFGAGYAASLINLARK